MDAFIVVVANFLVLNFPDITNVLWRLFLNAAGNSKRFVYVVAIYILHTFGIYYKAIAAMYPNGSDIYTYSSDIQEVSTEVSIEAQELLNQAKECDERPLPFIRKTSELYCKPTFDQFLCWDYAKAGTTVYQNCPPDMPFIDPSKQARRQCGPDGNWLDRNNQTSLKGWTDYIKCFPPYMQELLEHIAKSTDMNAKFATAVWIRCVELFGLCSSSVSLGVALYFFYKYPTLLNCRTKIHRHLFIVLLGQSMTGLMIYVDQETYNILPHYNSLCIFTYLVLEILTSISFAFMLIEGITLRQLISAGVLQPCMSRRVVIAGYICPTGITMIWFAVAKYVYGWDQTGCWYGYNMDRVYCILQVPRVGIIIANLWFLVLIVKTLLQKMATDEVNEAKRLLKALRATFILMPLLGITNIVSMFNASLSESVGTFAAWGFFAYFLKSFQGFLVSYLYCFKNKEVRDVICRRINVASITNLHEIRFRAQERIEAHEDIEVGALDEPTRQEIPEALERVEAGVIDESPSVTVPALMEIITEAVV